MTRLTLQIAVGATAVSIASSTTDAGTIKGAKNCGEYFEKGGWCPIYTKKQPLATAANTRALCCTEQAQAGTITATDTNDCSNSWFAGTIAHTCDSATTKKNPAATSPKCGSKQVGITGTVGSSTVPCKAIDCCQQLTDVKICKSWYAAQNSCVGGQLPRGNDRVCANAICSASECCYKPPRNCNTGFFDIGKICSSKFETAILAPEITECSLYDCTDLDCCKEKVGIGKCATWFAAGNVCGSLNKDLKFRKPSTSNPRCMTAACTEADCCDAAPTCDGFTGCVAGKVVTHITTTCKASACTSPECCVARGVCAAAECKAGETLKPDYATIKCASSVCTPKECCAAAAKPKSKAATCEAFKDTDCTGKDSKDRKYTTSLGKLQTCGAGGCSKATCCAVEEDATCFPGETEVSVAGGSLMMLAEIETSMEVLTEANMEPVIGMLHSHSEATSTLVHPTSSSA